MVKEKLKPEEFEASGGIKKGNTKWLPGPKLLNKLGFNPVKCKITVDSTGRLNVHQEGYPDWECDPKYWRKIPST
ncbi:MAG: hypothetical protein ACYC6X_03370 [Minisyncoccota bacterium]